MLQSQISGKRHRKKHGFSGGIGGDAMIRTPCGPRRADAIRPGDLIVTRNDGLKPVRAVWKKDLNASDMSADANKAPVRINQRAMGPMMPARELLVASDHRVLVPGYRLFDVEDTQCCLMTAGEFAEASDSAWRDRNTIGTTLFTFVFDQHQVFCASGLPVESFLPSAKSISALAGQLRQELVDLFPVLNNDPSAYPEVGFPQASSSRLCQVAP